MNVEVLRKLRVLTSPLTVSDDEWFALLNGWTQYFHSKGVRPEGQVDEFNRIMFARVKKFRITVIPPDQYDDI